VQYAWSVRKNTGMNLNIQNVKTGSWLMLPGTSLPELSHHVKVLDPAAVFAADSLVNLLPGLG
jgi:hypothetical protein